MSAASTRRHRRRRARAPAARSKSLGPDAVAAHPRSRACSRSSSTAGFVVAREGRPAAALEVHPRRASADDRADPRAPERRQRRAARQRCCPTSMRADVLTRMASLDDISPDVIMRDLGRHRAAAEDARRRRAASSTAACARWPSCSTASIATSASPCSSASKTRLAGSGGVDPQPDVRVRRPGRTSTTPGIREIIQRADKKVLTVALKGASEDIRQRFFDNMSKRAAELLKEEMEVLGAVRLRDVEKAQQEIVADRAQARRGRPDRHRRRRGRGVCRLEAASGGQSVDASTGRSAVRWRAVDCQRGQAPTRWRPCRRRSDAQRRAHRSAACVAPPSSATRSPRATRRASAPAPKRPPTRGEAMLRRLAQTLDELPRCAAEMIRRDRARRWCSWRSRSPSASSHREVTLDRDLLVAHGARRARSARRAARTATIRLHPDDYAAIAPPRRDAAIGGRTCGSSPTRACSRGGCLVQSDFGFMDVGVDAQFRSSRGRCSATGDAHQRGRSVPPVRCRMRRRLLARPLRHPRVDGTSSTTPLLGPRRPRRRPADRVDRPARARRRNLRSAAAPAARALPVRSRRLPRRPSAVGAARRHLRHPARRSHRARAAACCSMPVGAALLGRVDRRARAGRSTAWAARDHASTRRC